MKITNIDMDIPKNFPFFFNLSEERNSRKGKDEGKTTKKKKKASILALLIYQFFPIIVGVDLLPYFKIWDTNW